MPTLDTNYYLAALDLRGKRCLVVGAGEVGLEKIEGLLACNAEVVVVAEQAHPQVELLDGTGDVELFERSYKTDDLNGCFLVIAATSDTQLNTRVHSDAKVRNMLVNVVDVPQLCNFILPAIVRRGPIAIAISTSGASPALAKRMRDEIAATFGDEYARLAVMLNEIRDWARSTLPTYRDRKEFFEGIVLGEPDPIELLRAGNDDAVTSLITDARRRSEDSS